MSTQIIIEGDPVAVLVNNGHCFRVTFLEWFAALIN